MSRFLKFTDADGDPIYIRNDVMAIYSSTERAAISSMFSPKPLLTASGPEVRTVVSQSSGGWHVRETYEEILKAIEEADHDPCDGD